MQQLNLVRLEDSDIKYSISRFPDGEVQISLGDFSHKDQICVKCRITNAEELFIVTQVLDILDRHDVCYDVDIFYLMGMRIYLRISITYGLLTLIRTGRIFQKM